jgi:exonuclease SbcC
MITSIELRDFLSHEDTIIKLEDGVTIFVGENGAGKSSIIDAITFSLFGKHTRKSNKGLIRRGNNQGAAIIKFSIKDKQYEAERKIDSKGNLKAALFEVTDNNRVQIASGERKQFKESMTEQVEKIIGMDFEKLKIASIVQQGELNSIINAKPKEFKELLNAIIGIDKLDIASESMKKITKEFREKNRTESGHDDTQIDILRKDSKKYQDELKKTKPKKDKLELQKKDLDKKITKLEGEESLEKEKKFNIGQLKEKTSDLENYVGNEIKKIEDEIDRNKGIIRNCEGCFKKLKQKAGFVKKLERATEEEIDAGNKIQEIKEQIGTLEAEQGGKKDKIVQLKEKTRDLQNYVDSKIKEIKDEIGRNKEIIRSCKGCFEKLGQKTGFEKNLKKATEEERDAHDKIQKIKEEIVSLKEQENLAEKLQLKDNKCPVCGSEVEELKPWLQVDHIKEKIIKLKQNIDSKKEEEDNHSQEKIESTNKLKEISAAETILDTYSIKNEEELVSIQKKIEVKEKKVSLADSKKLEDMSQIDEHAKVKFGEILELRLKTEGFDEAKFEKKTIELKQKREDKANNYKNLGIVEDQIKTAEKQSSEIKESILELEKVKDYISRLDKIQNNVFSRDGSVATSLRSWALNSISIKASEYLKDLNTKIQRIALSEKTRDVSIACHSKTEVLELESLSGGEKVSVALALRLGMATLLSSSNLNLMILDEPTTHLDAERKKSLVEVLAQLSGIGKSQTPMQFLIITHDAEIFENEHVGQVHEFKSTEEGSKVKEL